MPRALLFALALSCAASASPASPSETSPWQQKIWDASWIASPSDSGLEFGVYCFRKDLDLETKPDRFVVHVSADNRYRLFVNGRSVGVGPARGDPLHWRYETIDLASSLHTGRNHIAAVVWNGGPERAVAQMSTRTGFILQGETATEAVLNTDSSWSVSKSRAHAPLPLDRAALQTYIVVGDGERVDGRLLEPDWQSQPLSAPHWQPAAPLERGNPHGTGSGARWLLVPRTVPQPEETPITLGRVRRAQGIEPPAGWLEGTATWTVPAHTRTTLLLDAGELRTAYPEWELQGGRDSRLRFRYAEALFDAQRQKGHRGEIDGKTLLGLEDEYTAGGEHEVYSPLWYRTFRYLEIEVTTADTPLLLHSPRARFTAYPFEKRATFTSDDAELTRIWDTGWRTARLCAFETYMDCPYYEQLQYTGDTRLQALISLYMTGDDRLMRNAIEQYNDSRLPEGLAQSRFPSAVPQVISPFSLYWIDMVHDHWMHRGDLDLVRRMLPGISATLGWFEQHRDPSTGLLGPLPYWSFVDWADDWPYDARSGVGGVPPGAVEGGSVVLSLQLACTLQRAAELFSALGDDSAAQGLRERASALNAAAVRLAWNPTRSCFMDTPVGPAASQHVNALAVLSGAIQGERARELMQRVLDGKGLTACTLYFRFYLLRAARAAGLGDAYVDQLGSWRTMLARGLTTFAEKEDPTRSDCHAWSATPNCDLLATVCGIEPASPGFATVRIRPALGRLQKVEASMPHPKGEIRVSIDRGSRAARVILPEGVTGSWEWGSERAPLHEGEQVLRLP